jgi:hypothetical protein
VKVEGKIWRKKRRTVGRGNDGRGGRDGASRGWS